jgi:hypothetical protein
VNYRRTLLWVWIVGSACWIAWWIWHYTTTCSLDRMSAGRAITCHWESAEPSGVAVVGRTAPALTVLWDMAAMTIGVPACVIIAGLALYWLIERFRGRAR